MDTPHAYVAMHLDSNFSISMVLARENMKRYICKSKHAAALKLGQWLLLKVELVKYLAN